MADFVWQNLNLKSTSIFESSINNHGLTVIDRFMNLENYKAEAHESWV